MISNIFTFFLKIIPLVTMIVGGYTSYQRANPLFGLGKILITQRDLGNISKLVIDHFQQSNGTDLIRPENFHKFLRENYNNQVTSIVRNLFEMHKDDLSVDLWGVPLKYIINSTDSFLSFQSAGPDMKWESQDDIFFEALIDSDQLKKLGLISNPILKVKKIKTVLNNFDQQGFDNEGFNHEGFNHEGFNHEGFNHEGFNHEGLNHEGLNREGLNREGLDSQGLDRNGLTPAQNNSEQLLQIQNNDQSTSEETRTDESSNTEQTPADEVANPG